MLQQSKWGHFESSGRKFVVTDPAPPRPWENYLYTMTDGMFQTIVTQRGEGQAFFNCPEVNLVSSGRNYCVRDKSDVSCWSINAGPAPHTAETYSCSHEPGQTSFLSSRAGIQASLEIAVASDRYVEVNRVVLENTTAVSREISLIGYHLVSLKGLDNRLECQRSEFYAEESALICERRHYRTPHHHYAAFFSSDRPVDSFCGSRDDFLGADVSFTSSAALTTGKLSGTHAYGTEPIAALQHTITLKPGEKIEINFALGLAQDLASARNAAREFRKNFSPSAVFERVQNDYDKLIGTCAIETPDEVLNTMLNVWTKCQLHRQTLAARSTPWFNWRNHLQDGWAWLLFDPSWLRHWILKTCEAAEPDGFMPRCSARVPQLNHPKQTHADIATWVAFCASRYYAETGDRELFNQQLDLPGPDGKLTVADCLVRGLEWLFNHRGKNGMALMRDGDWSDPLEEVGKKDIGESPWTSMALVHAARQVAPLLKVLGRTETSAWMLAEADVLAGKINEHAWDGDWYIRAITDDGERLCTHKDKDGRVSLLMQSWAVISGVTDQKRLAALTRSVDENNKTGVGPILYAPPFMTPRPWIGRETAKPAGTCVNGSCYNHVAIMWAKAEVMLGRPDESIRVIKQILPLRDQDETATTRAIPLWLPNYYHGPASLRPGQASDVMTGASAPWIFLVITDHIFGVRAAPEGLRIEPRLPAAWNKASFCRTFRGSVYEIVFERVGPGDGCKLELDGKRLVGTIIPAGEARGQIHDVLVKIG
jgi:cellobionic acid phosphorylase